MTFFLIQGKDRMGAEAQGHTHRLSHALRLERMMPFKTFYHADAHIWWHRNIWLHTHWSHCLPTRPDTDTQLCMQNTDNQILWTHTESLLQLLPSSEFFPWRAQFRWNVSFNGNGKWNNKKHVFFYCIPVKREKVFLLDGTTQALTHGSYGMWQWIPPRAEDIAFIAVISECRVKLDCFSEEH